MIALLLDNGADVNATDGEGVTILHGGISASMTAYLISRGADVNAKDNEGCTPLHRAASGTNNIRIAQRLLLAGRNQVSPPDSLGLNAPQKVIVLLQGGANAGVKNYAGRTPLDFAQTASKLGVDNSEVIRLLEDDQYSRNAHLAASITNAPSLMTESKLTTNGYGGKAAIQKIAAVLVIAYLAIWIIASAVNSFRHRSATNSAAILNTNKSPNASSPSVLDTSNPALGNYVALTSQRKLTQADWSAYRNQT